MDEFRRLPARPWRSWILCGPAALLRGRRFRRRRCFRGLREKFRSFDLHVEALPDLLEPFRKTLLLDSNEDVTLNLLVALRRELVQPKQVEARRRPQRIADLAWFQRENCRLDIVRQFVRSPYRRAE